MKYFSIIIWILIAGLFLIISSSVVTSDNLQGKPMHQGVATQNKEPATVVGMPVYKPPKRGTPKALAGGGSRGIENGLSPISALVPDHIGLTIYEQPSLYWYLSEPISGRIEFTLIDDQPIEPLLKTNLSTKIKPGVQLINLSDYGVRLSPDKQYQWFVALLPDLDHSSKDIIVGGLIERITTPEALPAKLDQVDKIETFRIYAAAGLWYDALSAISDLIDATPNDTFLRKQRASLLEQVGLGELAKLEKKPVTMSNNQQEKPIQKSITKQKKKSVIPVSMPVYKPPKRGAPRALVGGGTRGTGTGLPPISVLAPDHIGQTIHEQPSLYWYLSKPISDRIEFVIIDNQAIQPMLEINLGTKIKPGIQCLNLADYGVRLVPGRQYRWFVALVPDPDRRSKDVIAGAVIERIDLPESLPAKLVNADEIEVSHIYAKIGLWYDALCTISALIADTPNDPFLRKQRASLLEQAELKDVAEYDVKSGITGGP